MAGPMKPGAGLRGKDNTGRIMRRKNQAILGVISAAADAVLIFLSYLGAVAIRFDVLDGHVSLALNSPRFYAAAGVYALLIVCVYAACHLYQPFRRLRPGRDAGVVLTANALGTLAMMALLFTVKLLDFSRWTLFLFWAFSSLAVLLKRFLTLKYRQRMRKRNRFLLHVIVIGRGRNAKKAILAMQSNPDLGMKVDGFVGASGEKMPVPCLGGYEQIGEILSLQKCDEIVIALEPDEISFMPLILKAADKEGTRVEMVPMYNEYYPTHPTIETMGDVRMVNLRATPLDNIALAAVKRSADFLISLVLLIVLFPLLLAVALGVRLSSPGPVLFRQERVGKDKKTFTMLKFRSMRTDTDPEGWTTDADSRKTRFGSLIRKYSLDELPQLINVLKGDMSLVGPRPELPVFVEQFKETVPLYLIRQQIRPGMTGWAQVNGLRGDTSIRDRVEYDIWYIQNWSLALDFRILLRTLFGGMKNQEKLV